MCTKLIVVTKRHYFLEDPVHRRQHPEAERHPGFTQVVKSGPVALLRTCRLVHDEARPFIESLLHAAKEPRRYIFETLCLNTFGQPANFNIVKEISRAEQDLVDEEAGLDMRGVNNAMPTVYFPGPNGGRITMQRDSTEYAPICRFITACARRNILAGFSSSMRIGIKAPVDDNRKDMHETMRYSHNFFILFQSRKDLSMCIRETVVDKWNQAGWGNHPLQRQRFIRMEQQSDEEWDREWEETR
jgi:hypothetical protein